MKKLKHEISEHEKCFYAPKALIFCCIYSFYKGLLIFSCPPGSRIGHQILSHDKAVDISQVVGPRLIQLRKYNEVCFFFWIFTI